MRYYWTHYIICNSVLSVNISTRSSWNHEANASGFQDNWRWEFSVVTFSQIYNYVNFTVSYQRNAKGIMWMVHRWLPTVNIFYSFRHRNAVCQRQIAFLWRKEFNQSYFEKKNSKFFMLELCCEDIVNNFNEYYSEWYNIYNRFLNNYVSLFLM